MGVKERERERQWTVAGGQDEGEEEEEVEVCPLTDRETGKHSNARLICVGQRTTLPLHTTWLLHFFFLVLSADCDAQTWPLE